MVAANLLRNKQLSVTSRPGGQQAKAQGAPGQRPAPLKQSITWKYRQLAENQVGPLPLLLPVVNILHGDGIKYDPLIWRITG